MSNVASRLDPGSGRGINLDRKMREQREAAMAVEQEKKRKAAEEEASRLEQARLEEEAERTRRAREQEKARQEAARRAQTHEEAEARERERIAAMQAEKARTEASDTSAVVSASQGSASEASGTPVGVSPVVNDATASKPSGSLYGDGTKSTPPASMESMGESRPRKARPIPPDTKFVTVKNFPAHLLNLAKSRYPGRVKLTHADALAIEIIEALNIPMSEAKNILAGRTAALDVLKAERKEIANEEGLRDWARVVENKLDDLRRDINEVRLVTVYDALNYTGDVDNPHAPDVVSFDRDGVRNVMDKLKDEAASVGRTMRSRDVPIR